MSKAPPVKALSRNLRAMKFMRKGEVTDEWLSRFGISQTFFRK